MPADALLPLLLALPYAGSLLALAFPANARNAEAWLAGAIALGALLLAASASGDVGGGGVLRASFDWLPAQGVAFALRLDGFAWLFAVLVTGIGLLVAVYARYYMSPKDPVPRFFSFLLAFMGSMLGVVLSGNLIQLVFFWELTSLFSFLLIGYWHHNAAARDGARMALVVTSAGGLDAGVADCFRDDAACLVEWPERVAARLPPADVAVTLSHPAPGVTGRHLDAVATTGAGERCLIALARGMEDAR